MRILTVGVLILLLIGCARAKIKDSNQAMRLVSDQVVLEDKESLESFRKALLADIERLEKQPQDLIFGPRQITAVDYANSLRALYDVTKRTSGWEPVLTYIYEHFELMEVYGIDRWGEVFVTSYFEPIIEASYKKTDRFSRAVLAKPSSMVELDIDSFKKMYPAIANLEGSQEIRAKGLKWRGRLRDGKVEAYPTRVEIGQTRLDGESKILAWADPVDLFFLEIQGSGQLKFADGKSLRIGYDGQNGYPYYPIGRFLKETLAPQDITLQSIERHLRSLPPAEAESIMGQNQSYIFFRKLKGRGLTNFETELVDRRVIATDPQFFPKGALAWISYERPRFESPNSAEPIQWEPWSHFVFDQDVGGAIRGPGRVDLFWGKGDEAKQSAGVMKRSARLYYFVPRS